MASCFFHRGLFFKVILALCLVNGGRARICDSGNPLHRRECGWAGITREQCEARNCCFDNRIAGVKWCFTPVPQYVCNYSNPGQREECGWAGISREQCEARGCCFDSRIQGVKWCFPKSLST